MWKTEPSFLNVEMLGIVTSHDIFSVQVVLGVENSEGEMMKFSMQGCCLKAWRQAVKNRYEVRMCFAPK